MALRCFLPRVADHRHRCWAVFCAGGGILLHGPRHDGRGARWGKGTFDRAHHNERGGEHSLGCLPSSLVPSKGLEARHMRIKVLANVSRFCKASSDGHRLRTRVCSWSSRHAVQMTQGSDVELGGSNVKPRLLHRYAGWVTIRRACSQLFTGRLGSHWSTCE